MIYQNRDDTINPIEHVDEVLKMLEIMVGDDRYPQVLEALNKERERKGKISMCEVYDKIEGRGIQKGIQQGIQQEKVNTEKEKKRADEEHKRAEAAKKEIEYLKKLLIENNIAF